GRRKPEQPQVADEQQRRGARAGPRRQAELPEDQGEPGGEKADVQARNGEDVRKPRAGVALPHLGIERRVGSEHERRDERGPAAAPQSTPATPITPTAAPTGAWRAPPRARTSTVATTPHDPTPHAPKKPRPAQRPAPNATLIHKSGGRTAASGCYTSCTGFAPQRGASATLRNPSSSTTSSLARSWSLVSDSSVSTSPWFVET